ncbi:MAG: TIGR01212 family radical SAM protein [Bacillota bacterium]|nr:TIGR01212 family radical SAM protein [Bacillota bacterium]
MLYYKFSVFLKSRYGSRVYKLPVNIPVTCPNRDGTLGTGGCTFCGEEGAGFECLPNSKTVKEQIGQNAQYIGKNYNSEKFIAYFQNYSNTYLPLQDFKKYIDEACVEGVVAIYISTRPDCINEAYLDFLRHIRDVRKVDIVLEVGLQTVNYRTLEFINRGHSLAEFIDAAIRIRNYGLDICAHYILDFPTDEFIDVVEGAKILSALGINQVKCHSLYILKDTKLGEMYEKGEIHPVAKDEYIERVIKFIEYLDPQIVIQRLLGRAPADRSLFCNWNTSWWKLRDMIEDKMEREGRYQGRLFKYLNGSSCSLPR